MRIVLKPLGAVVLVVAIGTLALIAFKKGGKGVTETPPVQTTNRSVSNPWGASAPSPPVAKVADVKDAVVVYTDALENGWQERGWAKVMDYSDASPARGGKGTSIRVEAASFEAIKIFKADADLSSYRHLVLFLHGGPTGGQSLAVATVAAGKTQKSVSLPPLPAEKWVRVVVPFAELGIEGRRDVNAFWVQNASGESAVFHMDDIQFRTTPPDGVSEETLTQLPATQTASTP